MDIRVRAGLQTLLPPRTDRSSQEKNAERAKKDTVHSRERWINKCKITNANTRVIYLFRKDQ